MADYQNMSALEAMRHARQVSGKTTEEIAQAAGVRTCVARRYFQQQDGYLPGIDRVPSLCRAMGNTVLLQWQEAQLERDRDCQPARNRLDVLVALGRTQALLGDAQLLLASELDPELAREIRGVLWDALEEMKRTHAMLANVAERKEPLACLARGRNWIMGLARKAAAVIHSGRGK